MGPYRTPGSELAGSHTSTLVLPRSLVQVAWKETQLGDSSQSWGRAGLKFEVPELHPQTQSTYCPLPKPSTHASYKLSWCRLPLWVKEEISK